MRDDDRLVLKQIAAYCEKIEKRIEDYSIDRERFIEDDAMQDMLLMPVFQIGELAGALSDEHVGSHPDVPWRAIRGFRNIIAHDYGVVDPQWAWNTVEQDIPELASEINRELGESEP